VGALQNRVAGVAILGRVVVADRAAGLHRGGGDAVDDEMALDDAVGVREGGVGHGAIAHLVHKADVVGAVFPDARHAGGDGAFGRDDRGQRLVLDLYAHGSAHHLVL